MEIIKITEDNIDKEHICCVITEKKGESCIKSKKDWLKERLKDGLIFKKLNVRGKVFIEYIPAEKAWYPFNANGYMVINCFWVSGRYKGKGISNLLLNECIKDSKLQGKKGIVVLSSKKKIPYLSDGNHLKYKGFKVADTLDSQYELLYLPFKEDEKVPTIKSCAKECEILGKGLKLYYSNQCPYTEKYVKIIKKIADNRGVNLEINKYENAKQAQNAPSPFTTYSFFFNGNFVTNEILTEKKFIKFLDENNLSDDYLL
ncbi:GNAT family N-acetyltransferase [Clostridium botulinum]|uniref:N-acetyltransferase n=1 Tax=Clostridium botulinum TaxID=1491 RepID=UPI00046365AE|nr:YoaP domain-containing protein [Clostridium botulinum]APQ74413.1 yoaP-like family protein [Clostridium botulinum]AUM87175.1 GNAT family N-acetyltransferase [Clostridium botulinum]AUN09982.1 GNAT family N-acetyltransferase [Clostridium botulinum]AUN24810.1 GNAT family N-acetyltransferase [Clostridium botulinum]OSA73135.1 GNAT family N-acetyltransferase [Clostridium botulinum]